jgi:STE24 endopeptidase
MNDPAQIAWWAAIALLLLRAVAQFALERLNRTHVVAHADHVPAAYAKVMDSATYKKSTDYTLAKARLEQVELVWDSIVLLAVLASGVLPRAFEWHTNRFGASAWSSSAFLLLVALALSLPGMPLSWWGQFRLEERFGFNTTTQKTWWLDRVKGLVLLWVIGFPLLALLLKWVEWTGNHWWIWAWATLMVFQVIMMALAPALILPLFNKFTPLPEGALRDRLLGLGSKTGFNAKAILVMDGSKRSRHSNALFTGFGKFRKIVLFDTLVERLGIDELEAVLAHEIGHYKRKHIPKFMLISAISSLVAFAVIAWLANQPWFYQAFGFTSQNIAVALLLFTLISGAVTFWTGPLMNVWSRKYEYEADAYARDAVGGSEPLLEALRKLTRDNLSNLTPHPLYSWFYYSHPTLLEREAALASRS